TRGGQYGFDCATFRLITPSNFSGGGGSCSPLIVVVAIGEPGVPVVCSAVPLAAGGCCATARGDTRPARKSFAQAIVIPPKGRMRFPQIIYPLLVYRSSSETCSRVHRCFQNAATNSFSGAGR